MHLVCYNSDGHRDRPGQLVELEQERNTDSHSARREAQGAQQPTAEPDGKASQSKEQSTQQTNPSVSTLQHSPDKAAGLYTSQQSPVTHQCRISDCVTRVTADFGHPLGMFSVILRA